MKRKKLKTARPDDLNQYIDDEICEEWKECFTDITTHKKS